MAVSLPDHTPPAELLAMFEREGIDWIDDTASPVDVLLVLPADPGEVATGLAEAYAHRVQHPTDAIAETLSQLRTAGRGTILWIDRPDASASATTNRACRYALAGMVKTLKHSLAESGVRLRLLDGRAKLNFNEVLGHLRELGPVRPSHTRNVVSRSIP